MLSYHTLALAVQSMNGNVEIQKFVRISHDKCHHVGKRKG